MAGTEMSRNNAGFLILWVVRSLHSYIEANGAATASARFRP